MKYINFLWKVIIEKLLDEVDSDIKEVMLKETEGSYPSKAYELFSDAPNFIIRWQELRDRQNVNKKK